MRRVLDSAGYANTVGLPASLGLLAEYLSDDNLLAFDRTFRISIDARGESKHFTLSLHDKLFWHLDLQRWVPCRRDGATQFELDNQVSDLVDSLVQGGYRQ